MQQLVSVGGLVCPFWEDFFINRTITGSGLSVLTMQGWLFFFLFKLRSLGPSLELLKAGKHGSESPWKVWAGPVAGEAESPTVHPRGATAPVAFAPGARYGPTPASSATHWFTRKPLWEESPIWPEASSHVTPLQREREKVRRRRRGRSQRRRSCGGRQQFRGGRRWFFCALTALHDLISGEMHSHKCSGRKVWQSWLVENIN